MNPHVALALDFAVLLAEACVYFAVCWAVAKRIDNWSIVDVAWRERTALSRLGWLVALLLLGNFAIAAYALLCLRASPGENDPAKLFFTRRAA